MKTIFGFSKKSGEENTFFQYVAALTAAFSAMCSGMHYGWPSPSLPQLLADNSTIPTTDAEGSWIAVMPLLASAFSAVISALVLDVIGRKKTILISCIPSLIAWIMIAFAESVTVILGARFLAGISDGLVFCALPMYLGETADPKVRGVLGSSVTVLWITGTLLINIMGSYLSISTTAFISMAFPVLCMVTFVWMPESPYYLVMKTNTEQARENLKMLKLTDNVEPYVERISKAVKEQHTNSGRYLDLFTVRSNRKAFGIALILRGAQQFSGTSAITFYAQVIFEQAGESSAISSSEASMIYFAVQLVLCACCSRIVDKVGRKPLLILSIIGAGIALFAEGSYFLALDKLNINLDNFAWIPLVAMVCYVICFSFGMQTIPILMLGELFPTNVKAFGLCVVFIYYAVVATFVSKFFQITKDSLGLFVPFYAFVGCCVVGLIFIVSFVLETKGKTLEEIQEELKGCATKKNDRV